MRFLNLSAAWWLVAGAAFAVLVRVSRQRSFHLAMTSPRIFDPSYAAAVWRRLPTVIVAIGLLLLGFALMEPVVPLAQTEVRSHGLDIVIALDLSSSMGERMGANAGGGASGPPQPFTTRLDATKAAIKAFVARRLDDRIGLVVFSDNAYVISPLTFDRGALLRYVDMVDDQILRGEGMTAIGEGLALSNQLLVRQATVPGSRNKVVLIFTDGENTIGRSPLAALGESESAGIRVHLVGVDLEQDVRQKPPVQALVGSVTRYGGRYFSADTERALGATSRAIDAIEKGVLVRRRYQRDAPVYEWFTLPALLCVALGFVLRAVPAFIDQT